jgi:Leucine-rich repeat (LRR) protein
MAGTAIWAEILNVDTNRLAGTIPSQLDSLNLLQFHAHNNEFTGTIPEEIWDVSTLTSLRLDTNSLTGTLSGSVANLENILVLKLDGNSLSGGLPILLGRLSTLGTIQCRSCCFPNYLRQMSLLDAPSVLSEMLTLAGNQLEGPVRDSFTFFLDLETLDFSGNQFTGAIPARLFDLPNIREIDFSGNSFDGRIPDNIGNALSLESLALDGNSLTGSFPSIAPGQLSNLVEFFAQDNSLTGIMAQSICELRLAGFGVLQRLEVDCAEDAIPRVECDAPECCTMCFPSDEAVKWAATRGWFAGRLLNKSHVRCNSWSISLVDLY